MEPRWDGDVRGHGIADGRRLSDEIDEFRRTIITPDWVAEEPEKHILPHLQTACGRPDADFALESSLVEADGTFVVTLHPRKTGNTGQIRAALFALVGQIAETATYVRQRSQRCGAPDPRTGFVFEVVTGIPSGDGPFGTHGHLIRFRVQPVTRP